MQKNNRRPPADAGVQYDAVAVDQADVKGPPAAALGTFRQFETLPDPQMAVGLLAEIAADLKAAPSRTFDLREPVILYGTGALALIARRHLTACSIRIAAVLDPRPEDVRDDPDWMGLPVVRPEDVDDGLKAVATVLVAVSETAFSPIFDALAGLGFGRVTTFLEAAEGLAARLPVPGAWHFRAMGKRDFARISRVLGQWSDDVSRAHHLQFLAWKARLGEWHFRPAPVLAEAAFLAPEFASVLSPRECLLDAGACQGDFLNCFIEATSGRFEAVLAVEPDATNRAILAAVIQGMGSETAARVSIVDTLLGEAAGACEFQGGLGSVSSMVGSGGEQRTVTTIADLAFRPSVIKLDVNGAEWSVLKGAVDLLKSARPVLAVAASHGADGAIAAVDWLMETLEDYTFRFRLHGHQGTGAVLYAVPNERRRLRRRG